MPEQIQENKMGVMPVGRLLFTMSLPMVVAMLVQALYNVVDSIFVVRLSEDALTAVSMAFPFQNLMISVAVGTGVGINAMLSRSLGEKNFTAANRTAGNGILLALISCVIFSIAGFTLSRPFFLAQNASAEIAEMGTAYLTICAGFSLGIFTEVCFERLLQSTGKTFYTMFTQGLGAVTNIILDPVLIFGLGPFPRMGVAGAAVATVAGQFLAAILAIVFHFACNHEIKLTPKDLIPSGHIIGRIYSVGVPSIIMNSIGTVMTFCMNKILMTFTSTAVAVFGIYFKVQSFVFMPLFGLNNGTVPIVAYNYGTRNKKRIMDTFKLATLCAVVIMLIGMTVMQLCAAPILSGMFQASDEMLSIGVPALRTISLSFLLASFNIVSSTMFQALGKGVQSMLVSIVRQLVVLLPAAWLLARSGNVDLVWFSFPIAECVALVMCALFMLRTYRTIIKPLDTPLPPTQTA